MLSLSCYDLSIEWTCKEELTTQDVITWEVFFYLVFNLSWLLCAALGEVCFTGDTPMVTGDTVDVQFLLQGCASVTCSLTRGSTVLPSQDCKWIAATLCACFCTWWCVNCLQALRWIVDQWRIQDFEKGGSVSIPCCHASSDPSTRSAGKKSRLHFSHFRMGSHGTFMLCTVI